MLKNVLLFFFFSVLFFTGCAERGYTITTNKTTQTITTESISTIGEDSKEDSYNIIEEMKTSVKKAYKRQGNVHKVIKVPRKTSTTSKRTNTTIIKNNIGQNEVIFKMPKKTRDISNVDINTNETERLKKEARKSKKLREARLKEVEKLMGRPINRVETSTKTTLDINTKQKKEKLLAIAQAKRFKAEQKRKTLAEQKRKTLAEQKRKTLAEQSALAAKALKENLLKAKNTKKQTNSKPLATNVSSVQALTFTPIDKVYHKFGTSEVHGHVIYINKSGQEKRLTQTKIYLLPISAKLNHWFQNFYLKNKTGNKIVVNYLNKTSLNVEKNFEFYGVAKGSYYVIIESNDPFSKKNSKIYIAKKIQVGKHKKIMGVFSKKL